MNKPTTSRLPKVVQISNDVERVTWSFIVLTVSGVGSTRYGDLAMEQAKEAARAARRLFPESVVSLKWETETFEQATEEAMERKAS